MKITVELNSQSDPDVTHSVLQALLNSDIDHSAVNVEGNDTEVVQQENDPNTESETSKDAGIDLTKGKLPDQAVEQPNAEKEGQTAIDREFADSEDSKANESEEDVQSSENDNDSLTKHTVTVNPFAETNDDSNQHTPFDEDEEDEDEDFNDARLFD